MKSDNLREADIASLFIAMSAAARALQTALRDAGYDVGAIDGIWGPRSAAALEAWRRAQ